MNEEIKLIENAQIGDQEAFTFLYRKYINDIYKYFIYRTNNEKEAEDLTQETFIKMLHGLKKFKGTSSFKNWLFGIAKFTLMDYYRHFYKNRSVSLDHNPHNIPQTGDLPEPDRKQMGQLAQIMRKLPENYRKVLELRFVHNLSLKETAELLGKTVANIKVLQYRALQKAVTFKDHV